jgi:hypothetical protein
MANKLDAPNKLGMANYTARKRKCKLAGMDRGKKSTACGFANRAEHGAFVVGCWLLIAGYGCGFADSTMVKALPLHSRQISDVAIWDLISVICRLLATATSISRLSFSLASLPAIYLPLWMHDMCSRDILIAFAILVVVHPRDFSVVMISIAVIFCLLAFLWWLFVSPPPLG